MKYELSAGEVAAIRTKLGLSKVELSRRIGGNRELVRDWERGRANCRGPAALLLQLVSLLSDAPETSEVLDGVWGVKD